MCSLFSSPTKLAQKIKNSKFIFLFLHFLSNQIHKIKDMPIKIYKTKHRDIQQLHKAIQQDFLMLWNQTQNSNWTPLIFSNLPFSLPKLWQLFLTPWPASLLISATTGTKIDGGLSSHHLWLTHSHDSFKSLFDLLWLTHSHESLSLSPR